MPSPAAPRARPAKSRLGHRLLMAAALLVAVAGAWWAHGQTRAPDAGAPARGTPVAVAVVQRRDVPVALTALGTITAANTAVVHARVSGPLLATRFAEGQPVHAGQVLALIDPQPFQIALAQAEAQLARDQAQLANARADLQRYQDLVARDAAPKQQLDTQQAQVEQLVATVQADRAARDNAKLQLSYTTVTAPISGLAGLKQADLGNVVNPGDANGIVTIAQTQPAAVVFAVPELQLGAMRRHLDAHEALPVQAWDRASNTLLAQGEVASLDNAIDTSTGTVKVKALFPNADNRLYANQAVSVRLQLDTVSQGLAVPSAAVQRGAPGTYVFAVDAGGRVALRPVKVLASDADVSAVQGGLHAGDRVVVDGTDRLRDGASVEVMDPAAVASAASGAASAPRRAGGRRRAEGGAGVAGVAAN